MFGVFVCAQNLPDVVTTDELALAAGVAVERVDDLVARGLLRTIDGRFIAWADAERAGRRLRAEPPRVVAAEPALFDTPRSGSRAAALPAAVSSAAHALVVLAIVVITSAGLATSGVRVEAIADEPLRLVYLTQPGPGGGGGGGGLRHNARPPRAKRAGSSSVSSPVPQPRPPAPDVAPPKESPRDTPPAEIVAPVAQHPADDETQEGALADTAGPAESRGPGDGGGTGDGVGTGIGEGTGPGLGPGHGGGTGGGPYRPGSGIEPPRLLREVKATYSDEARRLGIRGEVVLEIVVQREGTVGDVRVLRGLGHGLDQRAIDAVRQWRFAPATRLGSPVDVLVEVAVEFRLR